MAKSNLFYQTRLNDGTLVYKPIEPGTPIEEWMTVIEILGDIVLVSVDIVNPKRDMILLSTDMMDDGHPIGLFLEKLIDVLGGTYNEREIANAQVTLLNANNVRNVTFIHDVIK